MDRFNVLTPDRLIAWRVSAKRARTIASDPSGIFRIEGADVPRFGIKIAKWPTRSPIILRDRQRPAFYGSYRTIEAACRAMDNAVRRDRGMPERINLTVDEIRAAMGVAS